MQTNEIRVQVCPKCRKLFSERGAVLRVDNVTIICPDCGTREALESIGVDETEQEKILDSIHQCEWQINLSFLMY